MNDPLSGVIGYRERKIARLEILVSHFLSILVDVYDQPALSAWEHFNKELQIQHSYLQHELLGAI